METEKNKIVQSLYLCTTNSREKMQQSIIENILYSLDTPLSKVELLDFIKSEFHLEIDKFELTEALKKLSSEKILKENDGKYILTDDSKQNILRNVLENKDVEKKRKDRIIELVKSFDCQLSDGEMQDIANLFNDYIYDCFLEHGRNAIKFFMPFKNEINSNGNVLKAKLNSLKNPNQKKAFASLVSSYSMNLTKDELDYLENLAIKAEYFFSLGIPEESFNKAQDFKLNGLVILVDTNFIYSILGLHSHRQNENCNQITQLISDKKIDCRLVFIRKTLEELQNKRYDFERSITSENLTYNQIKSLLDSDSLNGFSKEYFEKKIVDPETPHPSEKIKHSQRILTSKKVQVYNYSFPHLEDSAFINAKFEDYYDYVNIKNEARARLELYDLPQKADKKLEHDIYLREAVISLRKEKNKMNDLNYICLTLDRGLIDFDRFANGRNAKGQVDIAPNFLLPSIFLRKIRPFIPIVTDDYKKAFITSITSNTLDTSLPQYSDAVQRSMTYFKKLGIDDYDLIISIIKHELFFKEFIESEKEEKQEEFIRSEIDKAYEQIKIEKEKAKEDLKLAEKRRVQELENEKLKIDDLENNISVAKDSFNQEKNVLSNEIEKTKQEKESVEESKSSERILLKNNLLDEKQLTLNDLSKQKISIEKQGENAYSLYVFWYCLIIIGYFIALAIITWQIGWDIMEPITYFLGTIGIIASYIYPAIMGKDKDARLHFEQKRLELINLKYTQFHFNIERYEKLLEDKKNLKNEIEELKTAHNNVYTK
ncbi:MAG: hypothetical protein U1C58_10005 [Flavobacteriaceae bacterium]|nr:hypothetical protein [Flavobacteriaceae bacterium]